MVDLTKKAKSFACELKNTSKNKEEYNQFVDERLISRVGVSQNDETAKLFLTEQSKQNPKPNESGGGWIYMSKGCHHPWTCPPSGIKNDTRPNGTKTVTQHQNRFWMLSSFNIS